MSGTIEEASAAEKAVLACVNACAAEWGKPAEDTEGEILSCEEAATRASAALHPVVEQLRAVADREVELIGLSAASYAEGAVELAKLMKTSPPSRSVRAGAGWYQTEELDVGNLRSKVRQEFSRVLARLRRLSLSGAMPAEGLWTFEGPKVILLGDLNMLSGMSRKLMRYFIRHQNVDLEYQELAEEVWGREFVPDGTIRQGISQWRTDLESLNPERDLKAEIGDKLESLGEGMGYIFRH